MPLTVDLNADIGDAGTAPADLGPPTLFSLITSANIACGLHAGDAASMSALLGLAKHHGVAVGAHPGLPDPEGRGRRELAVSAEEVEHLVAARSGAFAELAARAGVLVQHVKVHGALYNMAARDRGLAKAVVRGVTSVDRGLLLFAPPGSAMARAAADAGVQVACEAFADRAYRPNGSLVPRGTRGAVIEDVPTVAARAVEMVRASGIDADDGTRLAIKVHTLCVHGDTPGALALITAVRRALDGAGVRVAVPGG